MDQASSDYGARKAGWRRDGDHVARFGAGNRNRNPGIIGPKWPVPAVVLNNIRTRTSKQSWIDALR